MPSLIDERIRTKVIQRRFNGVPRDKIAAQSNIGAGTVSSIIANYKAELEDLEFDSIRQLSVEAKKQGVTLNELASHLRLYNYFRSLGASENEIESFITNVNSGCIPLEKNIELENQIHEISKSESVPLINYQIISKKN